MSTLEWTYNCVVDPVFLQGGYCQLPTWETEIETTRKENEAYEKAEQLLCESLSDEQLQELQQDRRFRVISADGERTYQVRRGSIENVVLLNREGLPIRRFCIHPHDVPDADTMLAQKLFIESNEDEFVRIANKTELVA